MKTILMAGAATLLGLGLSTGAMADDRAPNAGEKEAIGKALKAAGFVSWEEIELDDDGPYWDVDDARMADGTKYDLKLRPGTFEIFDRDRDD